MTESTARLGKQRGVGGGGRERESEAWWEWAGTRLLFGSRCHAMFDKHSCPSWPAAVLHLYYSTESMLRSVCMRGAHGARARSYVSVGAFLRGSQWLHVNWELENLKEGRKESRVRKSSTDRPHWWRCSDFSVLSANAKAVSVTFTAFALFPPRRLTWCTRTCSTTSTSTTVRSSGASFTGPCVLPSTRGRRRTRITSYLQGMVSSLTKKKLPY